MAHVRLSGCSFTNWLDDGPRAAQVEAFKQYLTERGYAKTTLANCVGSVAHFAQWLHRRGVDVQRIDESVLSEFLDGHVPCCRCTGAVQRHRPSLSAALGHLLVVLRTQGVIAPPVVSKTPVDDELRRYGEYMERVRGLAPATRRLALSIVRRLLIWRFGDYAIDITVVRAEHIRHFFAEEARRYSKPAGAGTVVAALRGYFRYRGLPWRCRTRAHWRAVLPCQLAIGLASQEPHARGSPALDRVSRSSQPLPAAQCRHRALRTRPWAS